MTTNNWGLRVFRGGGWGSDPRNARLAYRVSNAPGARFYALGVRLSRWVNPFEILLLEERNE